MNSLKQVFLYVIVRSMIIYTEIFNILGLVRVAAKKSLSGPATKGGGRIGG